MLTGRTDAVTIVATAIREAHASASPQYIANQAIDRLIESEVMLALLSAPPSVRQRVLGSFK